MYISDDLTSVNCSDHQASAQRPRTRNHLVPGITVNVTVLVQGRAVLRRPDHSHSPSMYSRVIYFFNLIFDL